MVSDSGGLEVSPSGLMRELISYIHAGITLFRLGDPLLRRGATSQGRCLEQVSNLCAVPNPPVLGTSAQNSSGVTRPTESWSRLSRVLGDVSVGSSHPTGGCWRSRVFRNSEVSICKSERRVLERADFGQIMLLKAGAVALRVFYRGVPFRGGLLDPW